MSLLATAYKTCWPKRLYMIIKLNNFYVSTYYLFESTILKKNLKFSLTGKLVWNGGLYPKVVASPISEETRPELEATMCILST